MGEPLKIVELIRKLCLLHGKQLGKNLPLKIVGTRPDKKLNEELSYPEEKVYKVSDGILVNRFDPPDFETIVHGIEKILGYAILNNLQQTKEKIHKIASAPNQRKNIDYVDPNTYRETELAARTATQEKQQSLRSHRKTGSKDP